MKSYKLVNFCEFDEKPSKSYCAIHNVDPKLNLGDITKVDETKLEPFNFICGGSPCFTKDAMVLTEKGYVSIQDVQVGDFVLTQKNRYKKVLRTGGNKEKELLNLKSMGILDTIATYNHPFMIRTRTKIWNNKQRKYDFEFTDVYEKQLKNIEKDDYIGIPIIKESENVLELSKSECWLLGRYVADGYIRDSKRPNRKNSYNHQTIFCIGKEKLDYFKAKTLNCGYNISFKEDRTVFKAYIINEKFMNFAKLCGKGAKNKIVPMEILNLPIDYLKEFLNGYMSGDGSYDEKNDLYKATTISKELVMSLQLVVQKVYNVGAKTYKTIRPKTTIIENRVVNQNNTYQLTFSKNKELKHSWILINNAIWYPIRKIEKLDYKEDVYNLEVEEDNTYVVNNCYVHNCQDFSIAGKQKGSMWTCKECGEEYNPITQHFSKRDCCPKCGSKNLDKSRSSLLVEWLRIVRTNKPNFGIYENVKNITCGKHRQTFDLFIKELQEYGYNTYWKVLKASNYGLPQERERVYVVIIKKEIDNGFFEFPKEISVSCGVENILQNENEVDNRYYHICPSMIKAIEQGKCAIIENNQPSRTVTTKQNRWNNAGFVHGKNNELRFFTGLETFKLMGFSEKDYNKAFEVNPSIDTMYKQAGNSICVNVLYYIYKQIYEAMPFLFDDLRVSSYFSGIGAFEKALDLLYKTID